VRGEGKVKGEVEGGIWPNQKFWRGGHYHHLLRKALI